MFTFRRKPKKAPEAPTPPRASPSLPELHSQGLAWPVELVDAEGLKDLLLPREESGQSRPNSNSKPSSTGAAVLTAAAGGGRGPSSSQSNLGSNVDLRQAVPFHKPFRSNTVGAEPQAGGISSLYMSPGSPPMFEPKSKASASSTQSKRPYTQRRARVPPTFNLMVVGAKGVGKSAMLRLLLETADISPTATADQKAALDKFLHGAPKPTQAIQAVCVEICESRFDRVLFSVIDTPGLDFGEGRELKLERQVNSIVQYVDQQYADTMSEESKVVRQSKGDQHIHLCVYMIDPTSVVSAQERRASSSFPIKTASQTTVSVAKDGAESDLANDYGADERSEEKEEQLTMSPAEIRAIQRIAAKANVLPVIARADHLTDDKLKAVKKAVRTAFVESGIGFGVFAPEGSSEEPVTVVTPKRKTTAKFASTNGNGTPSSRNGHAYDDSADSNADHGAVNEPSSPNDDHQEAEDEDDIERSSRPVIKLRPKRHGRPLSRSRSRRDLSQIYEDGHRPVSPDFGDRESVANVRFSAHVVAKADISALLPFALIAPEPGRRRPPQRPVSALRLESSASSAVGASPLIGTYHRELEQEGVDGVQDRGDSMGGDGNTGRLTVPPTPASLYNARFSGLPPPDDLRGVFVRKFRWGTVDVLDPAHCDFSAMRTAVLSTHLKPLKTKTKEVLYEKYRTEKLLAWRATAQISEEQRLRLLEDLGL